MSKQYSLAYLTVNGCSPLEMIYIAAQTGYDFVSLRLIPMGVPGEVPFRTDDAKMIRKIGAAFKETGIGLLDLELARIVEEGGPFDLVVDDGKIGGLLAESADGLVVVGCGVNLVWGDPMTGAAALLEPGSNAVHARDLAVSWVERFLAHLDRAAENRMESVRRRKTASH